MIPAVICICTPLASHWKLTLLPGNVLQKMISFVECMLRLDTDRIGDLIGAFLLAKVVDLLTELDVCSPLFVWLSAILQIVVDLICFC